VSGNHFSLSLKIEIGQLLPYKLGQMLILSLQLNVAKILTKQPFHTRNLFHQLVQTQFDLVQAI